MLIYFDLQYSWLLLLLLLKLFHKTYSWIYRNNVSLKRNTFLDLDFTANWELNHFKFHHTHYTDNTFLPSFTSDRFCSLTYICLFYLQSWTLCVLSCLDGGDGLSVQGRNCLPNMFFRSNYMIWILFTLQLFLWVIGTKNLL